MTTEALEHNALVISNLQVGKIIFPMAHEGNIMNLVKFTDILNNVNVVQDT